jgi:hypothetical protein
LARVLALVLSLSALGAAAAVRDVPQPEPHRAAAALGRARWAHSHGSWGGGQHARRLKQQQRVSTNTPLLVNAATTGAGPPLRLDAGASGPPPVQAQSRFGAGLLASAGKVLPEAAPSPAAYVLAVPAPQPAVAATPTTLGGPLNTATSTPGE